MHKAVCIGYFVLSFFFLIVLQCWFGLIVSHLELDTITLPDVDELKRLLQRAADSIKQKREDGQKKLENSRRVIKESEANIESMKTQLTKFSEDFRFYQDLREYVLDLVDCLGEKV